MTNCVETKKSQNSKNNLSIRTIWLIILIVITLGNLYVGYQFYNHIQPYSNKQAEIDKGLALAKQKNEINQSNIDELKKELKERPTITELEQRFKSLEGSMNELRKSHEKNTEKIDKIYEWIIKQ